MQTFRRSGSLQVFIPILALFSLLIASAIVTPSVAQGDPTLNPTQQNQTLDAIVNSYFTQTAQPELKLTATLAARFSSAQTATAQALIPTATSTPTPSPAFDIDGLEVISTTKLDLIGGPANRVAVLSPDGTRFAYLTEEGLCIYTIAGEQQNCAPVRGTPERIQIDPDSVRWSPDSQGVVFSEDFLRRFSDSDIWYMRADSTTLLDLTPAPNRGESIMRQNNLTFTVDMLPAFASSDSSRVYFIRYQFDSSPGNGVPQIYSINLRGADLRLEATLNTSALFTYAFAISPDAKTLMYNFDPNLDPKRSGTWKADIDGNNQKLLSAITSQKDRALLPLVYTFAPTGRYALTVNATGSAYSTAFKPEYSPLAIVAVQGGGQQVSPAVYVNSAGWSPTGEALIYTTIPDPRRPDEAGVYLSAGPGQLGRKILDGRYFPPSPRQLVPIMWSADNTVLLSDQQDQKLVVIRLGRK